MNIITNNYSVSSRANLPVKQFNYDLNDGYKLFCRHDKNMLEAYIAKKTPKGMSLVAGAGEFKSKGFNTEQIEHLISQIQEGLTDGKKFIMELIRSQIS